MHIRPIEVYSVIKVFRVVCFAFSVGPVEVLKTFRMLLSCWSFSAVAAISATGFIGTLTP